MNSNGPPRTTMEYRKSTESGHVPMKQNGGSTLHSFV